MTSRSRALASVVLVTLAPGLGAGVAAPDDLWTQDDVTVHLVGDDGDDGLDTIALFESLGSDAIQDNVDLFDFLGDDRVIIFDVQALFNQLQAE